MAEYTRREDITNPAAITTDSVIVPKLDRRVRQHYIDSLVQCPNSIMRRPICNADVNIHHSLITASKIVDSISNSAATNATFSSEACIGCVLSRCEIPTFNMNWPNTMERREGLLIPCLS